MVDLIFVGAIYKSNCIERLILERCTSSVCDYNIREHQLNKYVSGDVPLSTHADHTSRDILQRCAWPARWPILGFWGSEVPQNVRFSALDADGPPCKI